MMSNLQSHVSISPDSNFAKKVPLFPFKKSDIHSGRCHRVAWNLAKRGVCHLRSSEYLCCFQWRQVEVSVTLLLRPHFCARYQQLYFPYLSGNGIADAAAQNASIRIGN